LTLHGLGNRGVTWAALGSIAAGIAAILQIKRAMSDSAKARKLRAQYREFESLEAEFGKSSFSTAEEVRKSEDFSTTQGIYLGQIPTGNRRSPWQEVFFDGEASLAVIAPPGKAKTTAIGMTTVLANPVQNLILNDISTELIAVLGPALEADGWEINVIAPFHHDVSRIIDRPVVDVKLDLFSDLHPDMPAVNVRPVLKRSIGWLMPGRANSSAKDEFFYRDAQHLGEFFSMHELSAGRKPTPPALCAHVKAGMGALPEICEQALHSTAFSGAYAASARALVTLFEKAPQQLAGGYGIADQCLDPFDYGSCLGQHTLGCKTDPRILKHKPKVAYFVVNTLQHFATYPEVVAMTLTYLMDTVAAAQGPCKVTALIDEAGALNMPKLADMLNFYRKAHLRAVLFYQDVLGQTYKIQGKANTQQILAACQYKLGIGLQEPETLEMFSKLCGTKAISTINQQDRHGVAHTLQDPTRSFSYQSVPLLRPEEIRRLKEILVVGGSLPPMLLRKVPYFTRPQWLAKAGPSPFYPGAHDAASKS
jgi:type IV secretory pathway TraG/TraD family ATPase VirD4